MLRGVLGPTLSIVLLLAALPLAQRGVKPAVPGDPVLGAWRGVARTAPDAETALVLSVVRRGGEYAGTINLGGTNEAPIGRLSVTGTRVVIESLAPSRLGEVALALDLMIDGNKLAGGGTLRVGPLPVAVAIELQRQGRADVLQPVVEQRAEYFVGRWSFEYLGGEFPPLSSGTRSGTATFTSSNPRSVTGQIDGEIDGRKYQERLSMTFDPETKMLAVVERRADAPELISVASWQSPLAINFTTAPIEAGGRTYQLRRLLQVISDVSFSITEEFSVDGSPFRRLGNASFTKSQ